MEDASKALIMAAEVLIGVMILSIGVYLFSNFGNTSAEIQKQIVDAQIAQFNSQFLKYYGSKPNDDGKIEPIKCTIHDIVNLAKLANKNNVEYDLQNEGGATNNTLYIQINIKNIQIENCKESELVKLIKENDLIEKTDEVLGTKTKETKYFKCVEYKVNDNTQRVNYMKFEEYK